MPDVDIKFLHRWYGHKISVLPDVYKENLKDCKPETVDKDAITLCIISHDYLDIFNVPIFPFEFWHSIYHEATIINDVVDDVDSPKLLIEDLEKFSGSVTFSNMFHIESKGISHDCDIGKTKIIAQVA